MTLNEAYAEKGLATTQIELWTERLKRANKVIIEAINEDAKPKVVGVVDSQPAS